MWWNPLTTALEILFTPTEANEGEDELVARQQADWYRQQYEQERENNRNNDTCNDDWDDNWDDNWDDDYGDSDG